jgi:hypothetical protein
MQSTFLPPRKAVIPARFLNKRKGKSIILLFLNYFFDEIVQERTIYSSSHCCLPVKRSFLPAFSTKEKENQ